MTSPFRPDSDYDEVVPVPKRTYREPKKTRLKDVDQAHRMRTLKKSFYACAGGVIGALGGAVSPLGIIPGFIVGFLVVFLITTGAVEGAGALVGKIHHPSGNSTPKEREYSYAESLAIRGLYEEAVAAYEVGVSEFPEDPKPYIRIARIFRDHLEDYDKAVLWFKRARSDSSINSGRDLLVTQELIELYLDYAGTPYRAIPELARLVDRFPDHQAAGAARKEMADLKRQMRAEEEERRLE